MKRINNWISVLSLIAGCGLLSQSPASAQTVDLWTAAGQGNLEAIQQHLTAGTDLNAKEPRGGTTPLIISAIFGQGASASLLIDNGADVNIKSHDGGTALHAAAFFGQVEIVKRLLKEGADINVRNTRSETPLDAVKAAWSAELEDRHLHHQR
jgi:ankyrin repeat protein